MRTVYSSRHRCGQFINSIRYAKYYAEVDILNIYLHIPLSPSIMLSWISALQIEAATFKVPTRHHHLCLHLTQEELQSFNIPTITMLIQWRASLGINI